mmetsp:Transcript_6530/g.17739  ORF Transcript_6530/g.17739 Transcript_6530/m.17739 type:complete len:240 (-) Transcript_6530:4-723(-)
MDLEHFNLRDLHAPVQAHAGDLEVHGAVDLLPGGQGVVQTHVTHDATEACADEVAHGPREIVSLVGHLDGIDELVQEHRMDHELHVVPCNHLLALKVQHLLPQVDALYPRLEYLNVLAVIRICVHFHVPPRDGARVVGKRHEEVQSLVEHRVELAKALDDHACALGHDDHFSQHVDEGDEESDAHDREHHISDDLRHRGHGARRRARRANGGRLRGTSSPMEGRGQSHRLLLNCGRGAE